MRGYIRHCYLEQLIVRQQLNVVFVEGDERYGFARELGFGLVTRPNLVPRLALALESRHRGMMRYLLR